MADSGLAQVQFPEEPPLSRFDTFKFLREEIRFQHTLINYRISWYVSSQAFLLSACAISMGSAERNQLQWFSRLALPVLGMVLSIVISPGVFYAWQRITQHRKTLEEYVNKSIFPTLEPIPSLAAVIYAFAAPLMFFILWLTVMSYRA